MCNHNCRIRPIVTAMDENRSISEAAGIVILCTFCRGGPCVIGVVRCSSYFVFCEALVFSLTRVSYEAYRDFRFR
jgi:hypothetical protein